MKKKTSFNDYMKKEQALNLRIIIITLIKSNNQFKL